MFNVKKLICISRIIISHAMQFLSDGNGTSTLVTKGSIYFSNLRRSTTHPESLHSSQNIMKNVPENIESRYPRKSYRPPSPLESSDDNDDNVDDENRRGAAWRASIERSRAAVDGGVCGAAGRRRGGGSGRP